MKLRKSLQKMADRFRGRGYYFVIRDSLTGRFLSAKAAAKKPAATWERERRRR